MKPQRRAYHGSRRHIARQLQRDTRQLARDGYTAASETTPVVPGPDEVPQRARGWGTTVSRIVPNTGVIRVQHASRKADR